MDDPVRLAAGTPRTESLATLARPHHDAGPNPDCHHVALCTTDASAVAAIAGYLGEHGFNVTAVATPHRLDRLLAEPGADLVILDADLPGADVLALARRLSERDRLGLLMLTSGPDCLARICSLEAGADDCLAKPAEAREVLARVKAILRRLAKARMAERQRREAGGVAFGPCRLDIARRRLASVTGKEIGITAMEFRLLEIFAAHPNRALNRDQLAGLAYARPWSRLDRSLDIRISRLRRKIEIDPARPQVIVTVRGIGYRYEARR